MLELHELNTGLRVRDRFTAGDVTIVAVKPHGDGVVNAVCRGDDGHFFLTADEAIEARKTAVLGGDHYTNNKEAAQLRVAGARQRAHHR